MPNLGAIVRTGGKQRITGQTITFPSQRRIEVNMWYVLQDVDQDGDRVRRMFVRKIDS